jgi:phosphonate degradation associated HDIG domain protein
MNDPARPTLSAATMEVMSLFATNGGSQYGGESVSQEQHALQAALFAERQGAAPSAIAAALLHDVGHLLHSLPDDAPERGIDDRHESLAASWLRKRFGPEVVEPVRLHVAAKRYLCAVEPSYLKELSEPSILSLRLQGGPMSAAEVREFESLPFHREAVALRRWDDAAKVPDLVTPGREHFARYVDQCASNDHREDASCSR